MIHSKIQEKKVDHLKRKIVQINEEKCNGCGACAAACHEGAIEMQNGKARLIRDDYCDGLGDCLPTCPTGAISIIEREAEAFDKEAVQARMKSMEGTGHGCEMPSRLSQWPVQIKLAPVNAPYFSDAKLLIAADCTAYAYASFHEDFIKERITLIGCPKLDQVDYSEKLTEIFRCNDIKDITVVRMEVPCCGGLEYAVQKALQNSGKNIPCQVVTVSTEGDILD